MRTRPTNERRARILLVVAATVLCEVTSARAQAQVTWTNGHTYRAVSTNGATWFQARDAAAALTHNGVAGYLATFTTRAEQEFVIAQLGGGAALDGFWLGGYQDTSAPDYSEPYGGWRWITGEPWLGVAGNDPVLPRSDAGFNNASPGHSEEHLCTWWNTGGLNDVYHSWPDPIRGFFVEFDEPLRITSLQHDGRLAWMNAPSAHVCFVQTAPSLTATWSNTCMSLAAPEARVPLGGDSAFQRVSACASTHLAWYPLTNDAQDCLGAYDPMTLVNTPFTNGGIYCNGMYQFGGDPDRSAAGTPSLAALDFNGFIMAVDFMAVTNVTAPIIVGGGLWRWGGIYLRSDGMVGMLVNDAGPYPSSTAYSTGVWHEAAFVFSATNNTAEIYVDGRLADRRAVVLNHHDDRDIHNAHYGNGATFKGYLRNLRVWNLK
jgi:hypothetical protein